MERKKHTAPFAILIFAVAMTVCLIAPSWFRDFASGLFEEFRAPMDEVPSQLADLQKLWTLKSTPKKELIEAGRDLARLNAAYELKLMENGALRERIERYENLMRIPSQDKYKEEIARVVRRDVNAWWQNLIIRKGSVHGIREGFGVISAEGVVGRVVKVNLYTSVVELVSSGRFRMATHFEGEDRPVIYQGSGALSFHAGGGEIRDVPSDAVASIDSPLRLVTSSLGGSFPDGIPIGTIASLEMEPDGIFKKGRVILPKTLSSIREVVVLIPVESLK